MATTNNKLAKDTSLQSILLANQSIAAAEQARNTTLAAMLAEMQSRSTDIQAWKDAVISLSTADKAALASAIYEVLGLNNSAQKSAQALPDIYAILDDNANADNGAALHNSLPRCKNLGSALTADQHARIADKTFKGLWVGDYIQKQITFSYTNSSDASATATATHKGRFLDMNYWLRCGDVECTVSHIAMACDDVFFTNKMNDTDVTTGGYYNSKMKQTYLAGALNAFKALVGENHILTHKDLLSNAMADNQASGYAWYSTQIDLMSEPMVYGGFHHTPATKNGSRVYDRYTVGTQQLSLFRHCKNFSFIRANWYWLREVVSAAWFAYVSNYGYSNNSSASLAAGGVRPLILFY